MGGAGSDLSDDEEEFASAPAQTLRRVIYKLFPLPPKPMQVLKAELQERQRRDKAKRVLTQAGRIQRACVVASASGTANKGSGIGVGLKRKNALVLSDSSDEYEDEQSWCVKPAKRAGVKADRALADGGEVVKKKQRRLSESSGESSGEAVFSDGDAMSVEAPTAKQGRRGSASARKSETLQPLQPPRGKGRGVNGWSIFLLEGWIMVDASDPAVLEAKVSEALDSVDMEVTAEVAAVTRKEAAIGAVSVHKRVMRTFHRELMMGWVVGYLPDSLNEGEGELWHVVFSDGDEEDWSADEVGFGTNLYFFQFVHGIGAF